MIDTLVVFGAGGDLAARLLFPAVAALRASGALTVLRVIGADLRDPADSGVEFVRADVTDAASVSAVLDAAGAGPVAVYLALPTQLLPAAIEAIRDHGLPEGSRLAIEKPFGRDAEEAHALNALLREIDGSDSQGSLYRVDHTLAVPGVDQLATTLPSDATAVEVLFEETLALEGRAAFYDRAGALRDVMQNHQVQLLCTIAGATDSAAREGVLRSVRVPSADDVRTRTRRARYTAGTLAVGQGRRNVPAYTDEDGVDPTRQTETFAEVALDVDTSAMRGLHVVLRAGKALDARRRGVLVHAGDGDPLWFDIDATEGDVDPADEPEPVAYRRIVADLLGGGASFCVSADEAELAWRIFTPVLNGWAAGATPLLTYAAGSSRPSRD